MAFKIPGVYVDFKGDLTELKKDYRKAADGAKQAAKESSKMRIQAIMGLVDMQTGAKKDGFKAQVSYSKGLVFFMETEPIRKLIKKKGRLPKTDKDMVEGLRLVSKSMRGRLSKEEPDFLKILPCGGNIQKTTVYKNGTFSLQRVAPFEKKEKRSAPLRIVS